MKIGKKTTRALLLALNSTCQDKHFEYKGIYEYKYCIFFNDMTVERKLVVFYYKTPVFSRHFKSEFEMITYLLEDMEKWENGSINYKLPKEKKKRGRKPKGEQENGKD